METILLKANEESYLRAAELLKKGCVVAIPTETVYGLAANALDPEAVKGIFAAKDRPQDNPLIVHIATLEQMESVTSHVPADAYRLAEAFWPGPLTMILPKASFIPNEVTAGLETVGVRMPSHMAAHRIIELSCPLAAPSANTSGKPSPTSAAHVYEDMNGRVPLIIDGGRCSVGVESTVVDMTGDVPRVLRPGAITEEMIEEVLGRADTDIATKEGLKEGEKPKSPGMAYRHYAPKAPVILYEGAPDDTYDAICLEYKEGDGILCFDEYKEAFRKKGFRRIYSLGPSWDHRSHDRKLFSLLRHFDSTKAVRIHAQCPREYGGGEGCVNRMRKSAGFVCRKCTSKTVVGLTGGSGSGKSLFCSIIANGREDILTVDTDKVYHDLLDDPASPLTGEILSLFPTAENMGRVDRKKLGSLVFGDKEAMAKLNEVAHRAVIEKTRRMVEESSCSVAVLDVPLLFQSGMDRLCTMTLSLLAGRSRVKGRIALRDGISEEAINMRLGSQPADRYYIRRSDLTLKNEGSAEDFEKAAIAFRDKYLSKAK